MTSEQRAVIAFAVLDPDAWYENAVAVLGAEEAEIAVVKKVARYQAAYDTAVLTGSPLTRLEIEAAILTSPEYLAEQARVAELTASRDLKLAEIQDNLPSWSVIGAKFDALLKDANAAANLTQAKAVLVELIKTTKKLARVEYWLAKNTEE